MKAKLQAISLLAVVLWVVGCASATAVETTPAPPSAPTATPVTEPRATQPAAEPAREGAEDLIALATADLKERLGSETNVTVQEAVPVDFSDASLGVPQPGQTYAQVLTPGYVIRLAVDDQAYEYHAGDGRVVLASRGAAVQGEVTIKSVNVSPEAIVVAGRSTFPAGTPIQTELLADGKGVTWWPESAYALIQGDTWQVKVSLDGVTLDPEVEYVVYAWAENDDSSRTAFPFDLSGPPNPPAPPASGETAYNRVEVAGTGLSIDVPTGWQRLEPEWLWAPADGSERYLGVQWVDLQPPQEPEPALLPKPSQTLESSEWALGWASGRRFLLEVYASAAQGEAKSPVASVETHVVAVVKQGDTRRAFDLYVKAHSLDDLGTLDPLLQHVLDTSTWSGAGSQTPVSDGLAPAKEDPTTGWFVLADDSYGYQIAYPPDWAQKELPIQGPGMPDDWPVVRIVHLYPQAWDAEINRSGPPDPMAKPVVAPLQIEVVVGPPDQFRRVYPEPTYSETIEIDGLAVTVEREEFGGMSLTRYVFTHPEDPELYVTVTDQLTGFPDRLTGNETIAEWIPQIVHSFRFADRAQ